MGVDAPKALDGPRYELRISGYDGRILTARIDTDD